MSGIVLRVGDELIVPGLFAHKMTYVGPIGLNGEDVVHAANGQKAQLISFYSIPNREQLRVGARGPENYWEQVCVQARAREVLAKGIVNRLFGPNCEHISSYIRTGRPESPQLQVCVGLALAILVVSFLG